MTRPMTGAVPGAERVGVAVVGGGIMGRGIVAALALAGHPVAVVEPVPEAASVVLDRIAALVAENPRAAEALARVRLADLPEAISGVGLVIEAVPEDFELKSTVWTELGRLAAPEAILASNTSAFDIDDLAALVPGPGRVLGTHWFNPAQVVPCVEVVTGAATAEVAVDRVLALLRAAGKEPAVVRSSPGFVANRIQFALVREALLCLEEGIVSADDLDRIVSTSFGIRLAALGPLANADLGGLDTYLSILEYLTSRLGERFAPPELLETLARQGRFGVKSGAGIADYPGTTGEELARLRDERLRRLIAARERG
jgi:3-hydroxybutyryl-CoA dehydrogenase